MKSRQRILAILEPESDPDLLVSRTTYIAGAFDCDVHLVLFDPEIGPLLGGVVPFNSRESIELRDSIDDAQAAFVNKHADRIRDSGISVTTSTLNVRPLGDQVLALAQDLEPAMIVKMTRFHSAAERSMLFDSDWQLLRVCPYPLWLVKHSDFPGNPVIAAAVDPMHTHDKPAALDDEIIESAILVADRLGSDVQLFHAYQTLAGIGAEAIKATTPAALSIEAINERTRTAHQEALNKLASAHNVPADCISIKPGRTHELLPAFVREKNVSLLVMGGISRWGIKRMIVGSTAERVMDHLPCDILVMRIGMHPLGRDRNASQHAR